MFRKSTLSNGIRVVSETLPKSRSVSIGVWVKVGSRHETKQLGGISHFIEHMFFKGTEQRSARDIAIEMDSIGGEMNAFTSQEMTTYYVKVLDEHLLKAVDLLSDILLGSRFDSLEMEKERNVILEEIKGVEDTPSDCIHEILTNSVWPDNPLGRPVLGTRETIGALTRDDILAYIQNHYNPREIVISAAGNLDHNEMVGLLEASFGKLVRAGIRKQEQPPTFVSTIEIKEKQLEQTQICIGCKVLQYTHDDRYVIAALNAVLGGSMSSRLFQEVREQRGLAYAVYSYVMAYRDSGIFTVYAGADPSNALEVVRLVMKEFRKIKDEGITPAEEERVKNQIKGNLVLSLESSSSHMSRIARQEMYYGKHISVEDILKGVESVTRAQVQNVARQLFDREHISLAMLGPISKSDVPAAVMEV